MKKKLILKEKAVLVKIGHGEAEKWIKWFILYNE